MEPSDIDDSNAEYGMRQGPIRTRRGFLLGATGVVGLVALGGVGRALCGGGELLRPPGGQSRADFEALCIKCDRCRSICPQDCITTATLEDGLINARTPRMDYIKGYCTFCGRCADVCPTGAIAQGFDEGTQRVGIAVIDEDQCLAFNGGGCQKCVEACSYGAVSLDGFVPVVDSSMCNGCGICENVCPSGSLRSFSGSRNERGINVRVESAVMS